MEVNHVKVIPTVSKKYLKDVEDKKQWDSSEPTSERLVQLMEQLLERMDYIINIIEQTMEFAPDEDLSDSFSDPDSDGEYQDFPTDEDIDDMPDDSQDETSSPRRK